MIRDEEIARIVKYAQGLGIKVIWKKGSEGDVGATWWEGDNNDPEITMYTWPGKSKTQTILDFVHELAHHMAWVDNGRQSPKKADEAFIAMNEADEVNDVPSKGKRKIVYEVEKSDAQYRYKIWDELGIKLPQWRLEVDIKIDEWVYKQYYVSGGGPTKEECRIKRKELEKELKP